MDSEKFEAFVDNFEFTDPAPTKPIILLAGGPGVGKTHLSCTMSEKAPVYLLDNELRAQIVTRKFKDVYHAPVAHYLKMLGIVQSIVQKQPPGTIIIDSATDLQGYAEIYYKHLAQIEKIWPQYLWAQIYDLCDKILRTVRDSDHTLVLTARIKEEYANDKPTGKFVPRVYNRVPYNADIILELNNEEIVCTKNGYTNVLPEPIPRTSDLTLPTIMETICH